MSYRFREAHLTATVTIKMDMLASMLDDLPEDEWQEAAEETLFDILYDRLCCNAPARMDVVIESTEPLEVDE